MSYIIGYLTLNTEITVTVFYCYSTSVILTFSLFVCKNSITLFQVCKVTDYGMDKFKYSNCNNNEDETEYQKCRSK